MSTVVEDAAGILEDPADLPLYRAEADFDDQGLPDPEKVRAIAIEVAATKPHLARRRPSGDIDQGARVEMETVDLASMLRGRAVSATYWYLSPSPY